MPTEPVGGPQPVDRQRLYRAKKLADAYAAFLPEREEAAAAGYEVVALDWTPGRRRTRDKIAALFLVWFVIGLVMIAIWLIAGAPDGTLTATYRPRAADLPVDAAPSST